MGEVTTDRNDPRLGYGVDDKRTRQNPAYLVLSDGEISRGYVQPYRESYVHRKCGAKTSMHPAIAATYARNPWFYGSTYCVQCGMHRPLVEFVWEDGSEVSPHLWTDAQISAVMENKKRLKDE